MAGAEKIQQNDREEKAAELERQYRQADLKLLMERLENDLRALESWKPTTVDAALKNAKDMKYLRERHATLEH